ncbi:TonB-dependent receptor [Novosphingobium sp. ZN18A2]|uniref:TonB-dependent receptor n=1 Tax=Novosphingobium sp. ZN18A2 TaxID=3079861 RepID=UPI0030D5FF3F
MKQFALLASAAALCAPFAAAAQDTQEPAATEGVQAIIVTATKRSENLQKVPISVLTTSGEQIQDLAVTSMTDLTNTMPAVTIAQGPIGSYIFIRGIGTPGVNQGVEPSVSMFHDGIYMGRNQLSRAPVMDVQRVEVLRGPQSILFGKNTIGGAINVIDNKPTNTFEGSLSGLYGSDGESEFIGVLSGPITDRLSARVSARKYDIDGWVKNVMTGKMASSEDDWTVRGQLSYEATDTLHISAKWEHSQFNRGEQSTQLSVINPFTSAGAAFSNLNSALVALGSGSSTPETYDLERAVVNDGGALLGQVAPQFKGLPGFPDLPEFSKTNMDLASVTAELEIGSATLTSVTGYTRYRYRDICDCDFAALPLVQADAREHYRQFSQEIRLTSAKNVPVEYIVGGYYHNAKIDFNSTEAFGTALAYSGLGLPTPLLLPNLSRDYRFIQNQEMFSVFGQATWNVTPSTRLIGGLRWFKDNKAASHVLNKFFTGGWDYSALASLPTGTLAFGNTPEEYDRFLASTFGSTPLGPGLPSPGGLTELVYSALLGTYEHNIQGRRRSEKKVNWTITAQHDFTPDVMAYATVSTGTKGGGYDARFLRQNDSPYFEYGPENATSYEVGIKSTLFNNSLRLNVTAFRVDVDNFQVSIFDGATAFLVVNAAKARSQGIEFDTSWVPVDGLTINASGSILDAKWTSFPDAPCWVSPASPIRGGCIGLGTPTAHRDATGDRLTYAPEFAGNLSVNYETPITDSLKVSVMGNLSHSSSFFNAGNGDPIYGMQGAFDKIDARLALANIDDKWEIAVLGKNLTDVLTSYNSNNEPLVPGNGYAQTDRGRSFAVQARIRF